MNLIPTTCAICGTFDNEQEVFPANLTEEDFSVEVFSARRLPDRVHYRMASCKSCGLLRSDPVLDAASLESLYRQSTFDYGEEVEALKVTYGRAIEGLERIAPAKGGILDIGTGNGFVLEQALAQGWQDVRGVEPSGDAIAKAAPGIGERIVEDMMRPGLFEPESFDGVTLFQVLDHIPAPVPLLEECRRVLRRGAGVLAFNHNVEAVSARLLKDRSPIVDIEHTYLYSPDTMRKLFERAGFKDISVEPVKNTYSPAYLLQLVPIPRDLKAKVMPRARRSPLAKFRVTVPLGNLCLTARA
ncbi:MAG: class I SAM-dependent methyltransferase [Solirubrobacteraceae bacterium]